MDITSHGFRAAFAKLANESGKWSVDSIERQPAHLEGSAFAVAYAIANIISPAPFRASVA
jgi:hypothetical protein